MNAIINGKEYNLDHNQYLCVCCLEIVGSNNIGTWTSHFDHLGICKPCKSKMTAGEIKVCIEQVQTVVNRDNQ